MSSEKRKKILILGDGAVGKTTLAKRFLSGVFKENYKITIGMDFYIKKVQVNGATIKLQIWDFSGEEKFRFLLPNVVHGVAGVIFMFDITRHKTLKNLNDWISVFQSSKNKPTKVPALLVGGKIDLEEYREVKKTEAQNFATTKEPLLDFIECSSKIGKNVNGVFERLAQLILADEKKTIKS